MSLESQLIRDGFLEVKGGVWLSTRKHMMSQQKSFEDFYLAAYDFSRYDFWITYEGEDLIPSGVDTFEEGVLKIFGIEECRKFLDVYE
jgi:hypothetical protein